MTVCMFERTIASELLNSIAGYKFSSTHEATERAKLFQIIIVLIKSNNNLFYCLRWNSCDESFFNRGVIKIVVNELKWDWESKIESTIYNGKIWIVSYLASNRRLYEPHISYNSDFIKENGNDYMQFSVSTCWCNLITHRVVRTILFSETIFPNWALIWQR